MKSKKPFHTELSINDIRASAWNASQGSEKSYKFLLKENRRLAKLANSRLRALEKSKLDMFSYDRAITYLHNRDLRRFPTALPEPTDYRAVVNQLQELVTFINAKTSTVAGARKTLDAKINVIEEHTGKTFTPEQRIRIGHLLGNDSISSLLREVRGGSEDVIDTISELSIADANTEQISSIIDKHLAGYDPFGFNADYLSYDEMMDELRQLYRSKNEEEEEE